LKIHNNVPAVKANIAPDPSLSVDEAKNNKFQSIIQNKLDEKDQKKLFAACQELEAVWLSKVMETMRNSIDRSDFIPRSFADETFESMLYDEYAKSMSQTGQIGIAEMLYNQFSNPGIKPDPNVEEE